MIRNPNLFLFIVLMPGLIFLQACAMSQTTSLVQASDQGQFEEVDRLLSAGVSPNEETSEGVTPVFAASAKGYDKIVKRLLDSKANVDAAVKKTFKSNKQITVKGTTPVMAALENGHSFVVYMLLSQEANVKLADENGLSPILIAAAKKDVKMLGDLIDRGAKVNDRTSSPFDQNGETVFAGTTPLMAAVANNRDDNALLLMQKGADVKAVAKNGVDALFMASANGDEEMVKILLKKGAEPKNQTTQEFKSREKIVFLGSDALLAASDGGYTGVVKFLLKAGADPTASSQNGTTALMAASARGHLDIVKVLLAAEADVNAKTTERYQIGKEVFPKGWSVLSAAAWGGHASVVQLLIDNGADVNIKDDEYLIDPLFLAATKGHTEVAKILIEYGADVFAVNHHGTARNAAEHYGHPVILQMIDDTREKIKQEEEAEQNEKEQPPEYEPSFKGQKE
jgi:serine/threonine-protein phosphatase 6 regulatory ankyrin repeat subunit B